MFRILLLSVWTPERHETDSPVRMSSRSLGAVARPVRVLVNHGQHICEAGAGSKYAL